MEKAYDYQFKPEAFEELTQKKSRKKTGGNEWVMSFADVVTVLLCFFIIFYMIEKQFAKTTGFGVSSGTVQEYKTKMSTPEVLALIETIKVMPQVKMINTDQFLEVHFPPEMFFKSGRTELTKEGESVIQDIIKPLKSLEKGYFLQVQGYTDDTPVRKGGKYKSNMELSIKRSLEVYYYLVNNGVKKNILTVTGFGENKPLINEAKKMQRRISLKFEPAIYNGEKNE